MRTYPLFLTLPLLTLTSLALAQPDPQKYIRVSYDVSDLIPGPDNANYGPKMNALINAIVAATSNTVDHAPWKIIQYPGIPATAGAPAIQPSSITNDAATGDGSIAGYSTSLIISQTPEVQKRISEYLQLLRHPRPATQPAKP